MSLIVGLPPLMNPRAHDIVKELQKLKASGYPEAHWNPTHQTPLMGELLVILAEEQRKSAEILEGHTKALLGPMEALLRETKALRWLTVGLLILTAGLLVFTVFLAVGH